MYVSSLLAVIHDLEVACSHLPFHHMVDKIGAVDSGSGLLVTPSSDV